MNSKLVFLTIASCVVLSSAFSNSSIEDESMVGGCPYRGGVNMRGRQFFDNFRFFTGADPTHGHVQYVDRGTAQREGLINVTRDGNIYIGVDYRNRSPGGRKSVRLESNQAWTNGLFILDLAHMPASVCGSWPAWWTFGPNWPNGGEIDIIEGVNRGNTNQYTLHTSAGCQMNVGRDMSGRAGQNNCQGGEGCIVFSQKPNSYGDNFNRAGGGVFAMEKTPNFVKMWHFNKGQYPGNIVNGNPDPCSWGRPDAHFPLGGNCPASKFAGQNVIFDITFCGDWAGGVYGQSGCPGNCRDYVTNNPGAFRDVYWSIKSMQVFPR
jgi:hypothetical protein